MKKINILFLIIPLIFINVTHSFAQNTLRANDKTVAHLKQFRADYIKSFMNKKPELVANYFSENIRLMPEFQKTIMGKGNTILYHKAFSDRFDVKSYNRNELEVLDLGSQVMELGKLSIKITLKSTGKDYELIGTYMNIWEKSNDGELKLITEAWNYDQWYDEIDQYLRFDAVPAVQMAFQPHLPINSSISFELAALNKLSEVAIIQHDSKTWSMFYADDAMVIPNYSPIIEGRKALDEYYDKHAKEMPIFEKLDIRHDRIDNLGDYVIEYATHVANWRNGDSSGVGTGKNIGIWRREPDCSLKLIRKMGMYD